MGGCMFDNIKDAIKITKSYFKKDKKMAKGRTAPDVASWLWTVPINLRELARAFESDEIIIDDLLWIAERLSEISEQITEATTLIGR
jgi:hypothetical protein